MQQAGLPTPGVSEKRGRDPEKEGVPGRPPARPCPARPQPPFPVSVPRHTHTLYCEGVNSPRIHLQSFELGLMTFSKWLESRRDMGFQWSHNETLCLPPYIMDSFFPPRHSQTLSARPSGSRAGRAPRPAPCGQWAGGVAEDGCPPRGGRGGRGGAVGDRAPLMATQMALTALIYAALIGAGWG